MRDRGLPVNYIQRNPPVSATNPDNAITDHRRTISAEDFGRNRGPDLFHDIIREDLIVVA